MPTEQQLQNDFTGWQYAPTQNIKVGQGLPILGRRVLTLSFRLLKSGSPTGDVTFTIRKDGDKSIIVSKVWGDASALGTAAAWKEVTFVSPPDVNETAIIMCEYAGGNSTNKVGVREMLSDVKAGENDRRFGTIWENNPSVDCAYIYTYELTPIPPAVTIQAMTEMLTTTAKGHGNVTALGSPNHTQHGHCWNKTGTPTTADSKTELGAKGETGAFESDLTELDKGATYYVRSYAINDVATVYSSEINFTARSGRSQRYQHLITGDNDLGSVYGNAWNAQTFTPEVEHPILKVKLRLYRTGNPQDLIVSIRAVSGGEPTGGELCYGLIDGNGLTTDVAGEFVEIEFDLGTIQDLLPVDTLFAIVFRAPSGSTPDNAVYFRACSDNPYTRGQRCISSDAGASWTQYPGLDILFEEWGIIPALEQSLGKAKGFDFRGKGFRV